MPLTAHMAHPLGRHASRHALLKLAAGAALLISSPTPAAAEPAPLAERSVIEDLPRLAENINALTRTYLDPALRGRSDRFVAKLTEGRVRYVSEDYRAATMILLELVETYDQDTSTPLYRDALFYLADSLYHIGNIKTASKRFEEVLKLGHPTARVCALGRLLEISLTLKSPELARRYHDEALRAVQAQPDPHILYQLGKYSYALGRYEEAQGLWARVGSSSSVSPQARYFSAVADVQRGRLAEALAGFQAVAALPPAPLAARDEGPGPQGGSEPPGEPSPARGAVRCSFRSAQEQSRDEGAWEQVRAEAQLAVARIYYETQRYEEATSAYLDVPRGSPLFRKAIEESVWVAVRQGQYNEALQRLDVQLIDEPDMLNNPYTRVLQGRLMSTLGRFTDALSLFQEIRERFELLKARDISPILRGAKGQLARYFQERLREGNVALNLESLIPKAALSFSEGELSSSAARSLFVELAALRRDVDLAKEDVKLLKWVLDAPNRSEVFPQLHEGLLKALEYRGALLTTQRQLNERARASASEELKALRAERVAAQEALAGVPSSLLSFKEREAAVERQLMRADLAASRMRYALRSLESQLAALNLYLKEPDPDALGGSALSPRERAAALAQAREELTLNAALQARAQAISDEIDRAQLRVGLYDEAFELDDALRARFTRALAAESAWLAANGHLSAEQTEELERLNAVISDFQERSLKLVRANSSELRAQVEQEERNIQEQERRLEALSREANRIGGQIVSYTFYRVLEKINAFILEADAGLLDVSWSQKEQRSSHAQHERERRRVHLQVISRDLVDAPR
jgi:tetratricopeptide (TPR) repeat protein